MDNYQHQSVAAVKEPEIQFMVASERWSFTRLELDGFIDDEKGDCSPSLIRLLCLLEQVHQVAPEILPEVERIELTFPISDSHIAVAPEDLA